MSVTLLVITDGRRDCIERTIPSALEHLDGPIDRKIIYDDSGDAENRAWLRDTYDGFIVTHHPAGRQGFGGAIRFMWSHFSDKPADRYVFHLEDDFTFNRTVNLNDMLTVMERRPHLVQMALRRQPWNPEEQAAGGIVELAPDAYTDCYDGQHDWLEHRQCFTTNPCLYPQGLCQVGWPDDPYSEGKFGQRLTAADPNVRFGYWGSRGDGPLVEHIGLTRAGTGY